MNELKVKYEYRYVLFSILLCGVAVSEMFQLFTQYAIMIKNKNKNQISKNNNDNDMNNKNNDRERLYIFHIALSAGMLVLAPFYVCLISREFFTIDINNNNNNSSNNNNNEILKLNVNYSITSLIMSMIMLPIFTYFIFIIQASNYIKIIINTETSSHTIFETIKQHGLKSIISLVSGQISFYIFCAFVCSTGLTIGLYNLNYYSIESTGLNKTPDSKIIMLSFITFFFANLSGIICSVLKLYFIYDETFTKYFAWFCSVLCMIGIFLIQNSLKFSLNGNIDCLESKGLKPMTLALIVIAIEKFLSYIIFNFTTSVVNMKDISLQETIRNEEINARILSIERQRAFEILSEVVPKGVAQALVNGMSVPPKEHSFTMVFFSDIEKFTDFCDKNKPLAIFNMINRLFSVTDHCKKLFPQLLKIETAGDSYMCVGGLSGCKDANEREDTVQQMLTFALLVNKASSYVPLDDKSFVKLRIGLNCGELVTGITGDLRPHYCCFGDSVNVAARMETTGTVSRIHISSTLASVVKKLKNSYLFKCIKRETPVHCKGKGTMQTYWLEASDEFDLDSTYADHFFQIRQMIANMKFSSSWKMPSPKLLSVTSTFTDRITDLQSKTSSDGSIQKSSILSDDDKVINFSELSQFNFNVTDIDGDDHFKMSSLVMKMIEGVVNLDVINTDKVVLHNYINKISSHYNMVPYHNFHHAFCVVQFTTALLVNSSAKSFLTPREIFGLVVSALIHDIDHPGLNNDYAIKSSSDLAVLYNNVSVLEMHHISLGLSLMRSGDEYNILKAWDAKDCDDFRNLVIQCILSTDMKSHDAMVKEMIEVAAYSRTIGTARLSLCRFILHAADISNAVRPYNISYKLSLRLAEEFRMQSKIEAERGLEVTPYMLLPDEIAIAKNEIGFLKNVAYPYWTAMTFCFDELAPLLSSLRSNLDNWSSRLESLTVKVKVIS